MDQFKSLTAVLQEMLETAQACKPHLIKHDDGLMDTVLFNPEDEEEIRHNGMVEDIVPMKDDHILLSSYYLLENINQYIGTNN